MRKISFIISLMISFALFAQSDSLEFDIVGSVLGGFCKDIEIHGDTLYASMTNKFAIMDISDPLEPETIGYCIVQGTILEIDIVGDYAYLAARMGGFVIVDISDRTAPRVTSIVYESIMGNWYDHVEVYGDYAYITNTAYRFQIYDISDPYSPVEIPSYLDGAYWDLRIKDDMLFCTDDYGYYIYSLSDPEVPSLIFHGEGYMPMHSFDIAGNYLFIEEFNDPNSTIRIIDIEDVDAPFEIGSMVLYHDIGDIKYHDEKLYLTDNSNNLKIIDVSIPDSPTEISTFSSEHILEKLAFKDDYAYIGAGYNGLIIVDILSPATPSRAGSLGYLVNASDIAVFEDYAFIADLNSGIRIIDISDLGWPEEIGFFSAGGSAKALFIKDEILYIASPRDGLFIAEIGGHGELTEIAHVPDIENAYDVSVRGNYAYIADRSNGMAIVDITDPESPRIETYYESEEYCDKIELYGNIAFLMGNNYTIEIVNISYPPMPRYVSEVVTEHVLDIAIQDDKLYTTGSGNLYSIFDISNIEEPELISSLESASNPITIAVEDNLLLCGLYFGGLQALSVEDPSMPEMLASYHLWINIDSEILIDGDANLAYIAAGNNGFFICDISDFTESVKEPIGKPKPELLELSAYPNPFNSAINIDAPEDFAISVYGIDGKLMAELQSGARKWQPNENIQSGVYLIEAESGNTALKKKIIYMK
ncbi:MAG: T9SS type A sorting domain-containing protein [Candidatus Zixiibacteriota bacterium]